MPAKIAQPVRDFCRRSIDVSSVVIGGLSPFSTIADQVADAYDEHLYDGATLQSLPESSPGLVPRFLFYASSLQTGSSVRMERKRFADYKIGEIRNPNLSLARVVGASSAFPPVLSPVRFQFAPSAWQPLPGADLFANAALRTEVILTDGGVYDNLGLEAIYDRCETVLVSDASAPFDIVSQSTGRSACAAGSRQRHHDGADTCAQATAVVSEFTSGRRKGTYWGIGTRIGDYEPATALVQDSALTASLELIRTRLNRFTPEEQGHLINWGYALADAGMRRYVLQGAPAIAATLPDPAFPL